MVATTCGRWCHTACVLWIPEAYLQEGKDGRVQADITNVSKVAVRASLSCHAILAVQYLKYCTAPAVCLWLNEEDSIACTRPLICVMLSFGNHSTWDHLFVAAAPSSKRPLLLGLRLVVGLQTLHLVSNSSI